MGDGVGFINYRIADGREPNIFLEPDYQE